MTVYAGLWCVVGWGMLINFDLKQLNKYNIKMQDLRPFCGESAFQETRFVVIQKIRMLDKTRWCESGRESVLLLP